MKKIIFLILLFCGTFACAQFPVGTTRVTATVTDTHGLPYANGTYTAKLSVPAGTLLNKITGSLDATGSFAISLKPDIWVFHICAKDNVTCFDSTQTISGTTQSLSTALSALAPAYYTLTTDAIKVGDGGITFTDGSNQNTAGGGSGGAVSSVNGQTGAVVINSVTTATTASQLGADGTNCSGGQPALGVDAAGNAQGCFGIAESDVANLVSDLAAKQATSGKGVANGYAALDATGKIPIAQIPSGITGTLQYQGVWNASTNSPTITSGVGTTGFFYKVSVAGTTSIDGHATWAVGDMIIFNGTTWNFIDNNNSVTSVAGRTGAITLTEADIASLVADLGLLAPKANTPLTGVPTAPTAAQGTNTTQLATTAYVLANPPSNVATATALAANGGNCPAGQAAIGVDASGAAEGCFTPPGAGGPTTLKSMSNYDTVQHALDAMVPGDTMLVNGTFTACNVTLAANNAVLTASGFQFGVLQCSTANVPVLNVSGNSKVTGLNVKHITNSPTAGGDGIVVAGGTTSVRIVDNIIQRNYNGLNLGNSSFGVVDGNYIQFNNNHGMVFTSDGSSQVMQWLVTKNLSAQNNGNGFDFTLGAGVSSLHTTSPTFISNRSYGNGGKGFNFSASAATASGMSDIFIGGETFASFNNDTGLYIDNGSNGGRTVQVTGFFSELAGQSVNTAGFASSTLTPSNSGYGVDITSACDPTNPPQINGLKAWENSFSGIRVSCAGTQLAQIDGYKNGLALSANSYERAAVAIRASRVGVSGGYAHDSGTSQTYGIDISNSADLPNISYICSATYTDPNCVHKTTRPTTMTQVLPTGTQTKLTDKGGQVHNVKAYGALGDGTTDDTTAIAAAVTAASTAGGIVLFPPGTYSTSPITLPDTAICANLQGSGVDITNIKARGTVTTPLIEKADTTASFGCFVRSLTVDMNQQTGQCWEFQRGKGWNVEHLKCVNSKNTTASVAFGDATSGARWYEADVKDVYVEVPQTMTAGAQTPYCFDLTVGATDSTYSHLRGKNCLTSGIRAKNGGNSFDHFHCYGFPTTYASLYCVEDWGNNVWTATEIDTVQTAGLDIRGTHSQFIGSFMEQPDTTTYPEAGLFKMEITSGENKINGYNYVNMVSSTPCNYTSTIPAGFLAINLGTIFCNDGSHRYYVSPNQTAAVAFGSRIPIFTAPADGFYQIATNVRVSTTTATSGTIQPTIDIAGTQQFNPSSCAAQTAGIQCQGFTVLWVPSGQVVSWYASDTQAGGTANYIVRVTATQIGSL